MNYCFSQDDRWYIFYCRSQNKKQHILGLQCICTGKLGYYQDQGNLDIIRTSIFGCHIRKSPCFVLSRLRKSSSCHYLLSNYCLGIPARMHTMCWELLGPKQSGTSSYPRDAQWTSLPRISNGLNSWRDKRAHLPPSKHYMCFFGSHNRRRRSYL